VLFCFALFVYFSVHAQAFCSPVAALLPLTRKADISINTNAQLASSEVLRKKVASGAANDPNNDRADNRDGS
jgi:hypothetical protein